MLRDMSIFIPKLRRGHAQHIRKGKHKTFCLCTTCVLNNQGKGDRHIDQAANKADWPHLSGGK